MCQITLVDLNQMVAEIEHEATATQERRRKLQEQFKNGKITSGDIVHDYVFATTGQLDKRRIEMLRGIADRLPRFAGEFLFITGTVCKYNPYVSTSRNQMVWDETHCRTLGIIGDAPLFSRTADGTPRLQFPIIALVTCEGLGYGNSTLKTVPADELGKKLHDMIPLNFYDEMCGEEKDSTRNTTCHTWVGDQEVAEKIADPKEYDYLRHFADMATMMHRPLHTIPAFTDFIRQRTGFLVDCMARDIRVSHMNGSDAVKEDLRRIVALNGKAPDATTAGLCKQFAIDLPA